MLPEKIYFNIEEDPYGFTLTFPDFNYKSLYSISTKKLEKDTEFYYEEECKSENILQNILKLSDSKIIKMKADDNGIFHPTI